MKKSLLLLLVLLLVTATACGKKATSVWQSSPIAIDGRAEDWSVYPLLAFDKQKMTVGISNDDENLFLMFAFAEPDLIRLFRMNGMTVWLGKNGEKNKEIGMVLVPNRMRQMQMQPEREIPENLLNSGPRPKPGLHFMMMGEPDMPTGENLPVSEIRAKNGRYCIEFRIPLNRISSKPYALDLKEDGSVDIGFEITMSDEMYKLLPNNDLRMQKGRNRVKPRLSSRGGDPGGGPIGRNRNINELKLWLNVALAEKN